MGWVWGVLAGMGGTGDDGPSGLGSLLGRFLKADTHNTEKCSCVLGFARFFASITILVSGSNVQGGRTLCHSLDLASRSEIINTVLRYFLFFLQKRFTSDKKKHTSRSKSDNTKKERKKTGSPSSIQMDL